MIRLRLYLAVCAATPALVASGVVPYPYMVVGWACGLAASYVRRDLLDSGAL